MITIQELLSVVGFSCFSYFQTAEFKYYESEQKTSLFV